MTRVTQRMTQGVTRAGATLVESLMAAGIGLLALTILFGMSRSVHRHDARLDAAATRIQSVAHVRDALSLDLACAAAPEAAGRPTLAIADEGFSLTVLTARRDPNGVPRPVSVLWRFDPGAVRLTRAEMPLASIGLKEIKFALKDGEPGVTLQVKDARGEFTITVPASESVDGLNGFAPGFVPIVP